MDVESMLRPLAGHDAGAFLPAMLQGKETVIGQQRSILMAKHTEYPALVGWLAGTILEFVSQMLRDFSARRDFDNAGLA